MLSNSIPAVPATDGIQASRGTIIPPRTATAAITTPPATPATLPEIVRPPSVPAGTCFHVVIIRAVEVRYCPISLATVSVAASARAATVAISQTRFPVAPKATELEAATAKLARICHAFRPSRRSASPRASLWRYPRRVEAQVIVNRAPKVAKTAGPPPANRRKHATPPETAPERLTPCRARASSANPNVTAAAVARRSEVDAQPCPGIEVSIVGQLSVFSCQRSALSLRLLLESHKPELRNPC